MTRQPLTYPEALDAIWSRSDYDRGRIADPFAHGGDPSIGLLRTRALLDQLGSPDARLRIVHVAGSKGKGSTAAFAASMCRSAGYRVGVYSSPHLHTFRERITVNGEPIDRERFAIVTEHALQAAQQVEESVPAAGTVTAFELLTAMALDHFASVHCEIVILEVGMGGLYDATNVITPAVSVITTLDREHVAVLGPTMADIARNKAGIIKPAKPVVASRQSDETRPVIVAAARERGSPLLLSGRDWTAAGTSMECTIKGPWGTMAHLKLGLEGRHQVENAGAAVVACWALQGAGVAIPDEAMRAGLAAARLPGRFERIERDGVSLVLDGAHTPASAAALATSLADAHLPPATFIIGMMTDKEPAAFLRAIAARAERVVAVKPRGLRGRAVHDLVFSARDLGITVVTAPTVTDALRQAQSTNTPGTRPIVVTGSLAVVAEAREALGMDEHEMAPAQA